MVTIMAKPSNAMVDKQVALKGDRLRRARERLNFSQEELAAAMGTQQQAIQRWEKERVEPNGIALKQLAIALDVTTDYLLGLSEEPSSYRELETLSPELRKLVWLVQHGLTIEAIQLLAGLAQQGNQAG